MEQTPVLQISEFDPLLSTTQLQCIRLELHHFPANTTKVRVAFQSDHCHFQPNGIELRPGSPENYNFSFSNAERPGFDWLANGGKLLVRITVLLQMDDDAQRTYTGTTQFMLLGANTPPELIKERHKRPTINVEMGKGGYMAIDEMDVTELDNLNIKSGEFSLTAIDKLNAQGKKTLNYSWLVPLTPQRIPPQPATKAQLVHEKQGPVKHTWLLAKGQVIFGRPHEENDLELWLYPTNDEKLWPLMNMMSGQHLCIEFDEGGPWVIDRSTNGTTLNGQPMTRNQRYPLNENDRLGILKSAAVTLQAIKVSPQAVHLTRLDNGREEEDYLLIRPDIGQPVDVHGVRLSHQDGGFVAHQGSNVQGLQNGDRVQGMGFVVAAEDD